MNLPINMNSDFNKLKEILDENKKFEDDLHIQLNYNEKESNNTSEFNEYLIKNYLEKIKNLYPQYNFKIDVFYIPKKEYIIEHDKCKELEKVDNYLRKFCNKELFISESSFSILSYGFRQTFKANRKLKIIIDKIKNATTTIEGEKRYLTPFEKFMMIYEYVTNYVYKEVDENQNQSISRYWVPVMTGEKIVCVGYASLLKVLCDEIFDDGTIKVFNQNFEIYDKHINNFIDMHTNNLAFIKDGYYGIDGAFYVDSCWDSIETELETNKSFSYCAIPVKDMLENNNYIIKANEVNQYKSNLTSIFLGQFTQDEVYPIEDIVDEILINYASTDKTSKVLSLYWKNRFKDIIDYSLITSKEDYLFINEYKKKNVLTFMSHLNKTMNSNIPLKAYLTAYTIIGEQLGLKGKELKEYTNNRYLNTL